MQTQDSGYGRERDPRDRESFRRQRIGDDPLDQRVDRWMTAGRQFVEGVAGSRPGGRPAPRRSDGRSPLRPRIDELGRWVEGRLDWLLDDSDDWREPWQESERRAPETSAPQQLATPQQSSAPVRSRRRQGLEAVSRRGQAGAPAFQQPGPEARFSSGSLTGNDSEWPDDASFTLPRWQRPEQPERSEQRSSFPEAPSSPSSPGRPLPRSSRRRP